MKNPRRQPEEESVDLYPGLVVHDGRQGGSIVPALVVAEVSYLIGRYLGAAAEVEFFRMLQHRRFHVEPVTHDDLARITELVERYADLPLGGTDASVVAAAERFGFDTIATLDHRHFRVVRPAHVDVFALVP